MQRRMLAFGSVAAIVTLSVLAPYTPAAGSPDRAAASLQAERTTARLLTSGQLRVVSSGRAPAGAKVKLQDRYDRHQRWATVVSGTVDRQGRYRLSETVDNRNPAPRYRVCLVGTGRFACSAGHAARIIKRTGTVSLTSFPTELVPGSYQSITGTVSRFLRKSDLALQHRRDATAPWSAPVDRGLASISSRGEFSLSIQALDVGDPDLQVRIVALGTAFVRPAASAAFVVWSNVERSLTELELLGGSFLRRDVWVYPGISGPSISPTDTATFDLRGLCRTYGGHPFLEGELYDLDPPPYTASIALDGTTAWTKESGGPVPSLAGHQTITLSGSSSDPERPVWFGRPDRYASVKFEGGPVVCAF